MTSFRCYVPAGLIGFHCTQSLIITFAAMGTAKDKKSKCSDKTDLKEGFISLVIYNTSDLPLIVNFLPILCK